MRGNPTGCAAPAPAQGLMGCPGVPIRSVVAPFDPDMHEFKRQVITLPTCLGQNNRSKDTLGAGRKGGAGSHWPGSLPGTQGADSYLAGGDHHAALLQGAPRTCSPGHRPGHWRLLLSQDSPCSHLKQGLWALPSLSIVGISQPTSCPRKFQVSNSHRLLFLYFNF